MGFALLNAEQLVQAKNADEVSGEIDVLEVKVNEDITIIMKKEHGGLE